MIIIPAVDIKDGQCVRLRQGIASDKTIFSDEPEKMAKKWYELGAERLHVIDLDGAFLGRPKNLNIIERIVREIPIPVEVGGGIRDMGSIRRYMEIGVQYVIIGTAAIDMPEMIKEACDIYPGRIILGIDAKDGQVAVEGWTKGSEATPLEIVQRFEKYSIASIIYTDIKRDGMKTGPNIKAVEELAKSIRIPVIASGGVGSIEDIKGILPLSKYGVEGIIVGRSLYDGDIDLKEALRLTKLGESDVHSK